MINQMKQIHFKKLIVTVPPELKIQFKQIHRRELIMTNFVFGIFGIIGGLLCAFADILFDLKGKNNVKSSPVRIIDSNWQIMSEWRFNVSILVAAIGVPLYSFSFLGMANQLAQSNKTVAMAFLVFSVVGASGGLFIHTSICLLPIISKTLTKNGVNKDIVENVIVRIYNTVKIPLSIMFFSLVIATSAVLIYAIFRSYLNVPFIFVFLNPLGLILTGWVFRLINKKIFSDLPGIIMPSVGIAMIGFMTVLTTL